LLLSSAQVESIFVFRRKERHFVRCYLFTRTVLRTLAFGRSEFAKEVYFPPYVPRFYSGWEPPPLPFMDSDPTQLAAAIKGQAEQVDKHEKAFKAGGGLVSIRLFFSGCD